MTASIYDATDHMEGLTHFESTSSLPPTLNTPRYEKSGTHKDGSIYLDNTLNHFHKRVTSLAVIICRITAHVRHSLRLDGRLMSSNTSQLWKAGCYGCILWLPGLQ